MNKKYYMACLLLTSSFFLTEPLSADRIGTLTVFRTEEDANIYLVEHYNRACQLYNQEKWAEAAAEFEKVIYYFPCKEDTTDAYYFLGACYFQLEEYDFANQAFTNYLKAPGCSTYFEEVIQFKFCIAEYFRGGTKRRLFKMRYCPKWASARTMAMETYDEIIFSVPNHELAARSLYSKGCLAQSMGEYRESVEAYQMLIRRFPKHELTPQSYLKISQAYCQLSRYEFQNPDLLALADLNARKFEAEFSRDERLVLVKGYVDRIRENFAKGLCNTGLFYERTGKPSAAVIYYQNAIEEFPTTYVADYCRQRLLCLGCQYEEESNVSSSDTIDCENESICSSSCETEPSETACDGS